MRFNKIFLNKNIVFLILCFFLNFVIFFNLKAATVWEEPTCDPPDCNVQLPINTGDTPQYKTGRFTVGASTDVAGYVFRAVGLTSLENVTIQGGKMIELTSIPQAYIYTKASGGIEPPVVGFIRASIGSGGTGIAINHGDSGYFTGINISDTGNTTTSKAILISSGKANGVYSSASTGNAIIGAVTGAGIGIWGSSYNNANGVAGRFDGTVYFNSYNLSNLLTIKDGALTASGTIQSDTLKTTSGTTGKCLFADSNGVIRAKSEDCGAGTSALPMGTTGQTLRYNGSTWIANSTLYNDGNNIGIGTTNPNTNSKLQINPSLSQEGLRIISASNYSPLNIQNSSGSDIFRVDQSGSLAVGSVPWDKISNKPGAGACANGFVNSINISNGDLSCGMPVWSTISNKPVLNCSVSKPFATGIDLNTGTMTCTTTPILSESITGSGSINYIAKWDTNDKQLSSSILYEKDGKMRMGGINDPVIARLEINTNGSQGLRINSNGSSRAEQFSIANSSGTEVFCINESGFMSIGNSSGCNSSDALYVLGATQLDGQLDVSGQIQASGNSGSIIASQFIKGNSLEAVTTIKSGSLFGVGNRCLYADVNGVINAKAGDCTTLSGGTNRKIAVWTGTGSIGPSSVLYEGLTNNRIGINNTNPSVALDVTGEIKASGAITGSSIGSTGNLSITGEIRGGSFSANGTSGYSGTIQVTAKDRTTICNIVVTSGLITGTTCP